jgi:hypothetical protein
MLNPNEFIFFLKKQGFKAISEIKVLAIIDKVDFIIFNSFYGHDYLPEQKHKRL